jgi:hypothetical protein
MRLAGNKCEAQPGRFGFDKTLGASNNQTCLETSSSLPRQSNRGIRAAKVVLSAPSAGRPQLLFDVISVL